jgi:HTH-type transcriptional regulator/antitoxin HipB
MLVFGDNFGCIVETHRNFDIFIGGSMRSSSPSLNTARQNIRHALRELRISRGLSQADLARRLGMSQSRLSEVERGAGSFTAEQLVEALRTFNVPLDHIIPGGAVEDQLQSTLVRFGALHLHAPEGTLPSERLGRLATALRETLVTTKSPRLLAALAPVLARNVDTIDLGELQLEMRGLGREARLGWALASTLAALDDELEAPLPPAWAKLYRRARAVLGPAVAHLERTRRADAPPDVLDASIRSQETIDTIRAHADTIAARWGIVTTMTTEDFQRALRDARE